MPSPELPTCQELLELVTDYVEEELSAPVRNRLEAHVGDCEHCEKHLDAMRQTVKALRNLPEASLSQEAKHGLVSMFRRWKRLH